MVRKIEVLGEPVLEFPYSALRRYTGHVCATAFLAAMLAAQYTSFVHYRTSHCMRGQCIYPNANISTCGKCEENYVEKYFPVITNSTRRSSEIGWLYYNIYLFAFAMLSNAIGIYFFNFFFLGAYMGFQVANCIWFAKNAKDSKDMLSYALGKDAQNDKIWIFIYLTQVFTILASILLVKQYFEIRRKGLC